MTIPLHTALTIYAMRHGATEMNPVVKWFMDKLGRDAGLVVLKLALIAALIYWRDQVSVQVLALVVAGYVGIVAWNVRVLIKQREIHRAAQ